SGLDHKADKGAGAAWAMISISTPDRRLTSANIASHRPRMRGLRLYILEAADGMGYGTARRIWEVELPLAMPYIVGGIR
ncbi:hypothetical protein ACC693_39150, partial [Rhizobium ruizarguesonis]